MPRISVKYLVGAILLLSQLLLIVVSRYTETKYFCWVPYDVQVEYEIDAVVDGRRLTSAEVTRRYRMPSKGVQPRALGNLVDVVQSYERSRRRAGENAVVHVRYRVNGRPPNVWTWPPAEATTNSATVMVVR
jgi:hypothetical protein